MRMPQQIQTAVVPYFTLIAPVTGWCHLQTAAADHGAWARYVRMFGASKEQTTKYEVPIRVAAPLVNCISTVLASARAAAKLHCPLYVLHSAAILLQDNCYCSPLFFLPRMCQRVMLDAVVHRHSLCWTPALWFSLAAACEQVGHRLLPERTIVLGFSTANIGHIANIWHANAQRHNIP